jgi:hypothetical protein
MISIVIINNNGTQLEENPMYYDPILEGEASRERLQQMIKEADHARLINSLRPMPQPATPARRFARLVTALVSVK